jgi:L-seryl-tRNA(Ser) seleniumtransferase
MESRTALPSVDRLLRDPALAAAIGCHGVEVVKDVIRRELAAARAATSTSADPAAPVDWPRRIEAALERHAGRGLVRVFNMTGTLLHTNLGRAEIGHSLATAAITAATHSIALEYDLDAGGRGDRDRLVEPLLCALTGAEAATVVNNNAAAVLLVLNTLAMGREVPISRGELIEIGGSFRMPEIISRAGCVIREVGTTNRTHPRDFADAVGADTALLLKVHPSNYRIEGFAAEVDAPTLADIAHRHGLPLVVDLGSGALLDLTRFGLPHEPTPRETLVHGADVVTFSGDKLLGAVQAGLIVGRAELIERIRRNPLKRALRCDKITLALLRETLRLYQEPEAAIAEIPFLRALARPLDVVDAAARRVAARLATRLDGRFRIEVVASRCQVGSGALPQAHLPSRAVSIAAATGGGLVRALAERLRRLDPAVLGRIHDGRLELDLRAIEDTSALEATLDRLQAPT